ncbi:unnamed protein product [Bursaphelenchus okinawaensis]|uniref:Uncharacterized protein n=1 Tax=Bursaphelenchus okinawaensis TaxID=465554 RepID=A0A811KES8_9BILA|nr:unnamed protein product [Bursaphelenchus okinawaensis]CAG9100709.1 unnamed protein product [Bursaphelenchus okinawaensis]
MKWLCCFEFKKLKPLDTYELKKNYNSNLYIYEYQSSSTATTPTSDGPDSEPSENSLSPVLNNSKNEVEESNLKFVDDRRIVDSPGLKSKASDRRPNQKSWRALHKERAELRKRRKFDQTSLFEPKSGRISKTISQDTLDRLEKQRKVKSSKIDENYNFPEAGNDNEDLNAICCVADDENDDFVFELIEHEVWWDKETVKGVFRSELSAIDEDEERILEEFEESYNEELVEDCF